MPLSTLFPQIDTNNAPLGYVGGAMLGDMFNMAQANNKQNLMDAQQAYNQNEVMNPLNAQFKQAETGYQSALARNTNAQADKYIFDLEQAQRLKEPSYQAALAKLKEGVSESELKDTHNKLESQLMSENPAVRAHAQMLYKVTGDLLKQSEMLRLQGENSARVASIQADAKKAAAAARSGAGDFWATMYKNTKGDPTKMRSILLAEATKVQAEDPELAAQYLAQARSLEEQQNAALAGQQPAYVIGPDGKPVLNPNAQRPLAATPAAPGAAAPTVSAPQQYEVGKTYSGKTGTYRYKGGDPANKANWEKVN